MGYWDQIKKATSRLADTPFQDPRDFWEEATTVDYGHLKPPSAGQLLGQNVGRQQIEEDLTRLRGMQQRGGEATRQARSIQQGQAAGQVGMGRGLGGGGSELRAGMEAGARSQVEAAPYVALIKEAEIAGYTRQEAAAAGLLAMSDEEFKRQLDGARNELTRGEREGTQQRRSLGVKVAGDILGTVGSMVTGSGGK